MTAKSSGRQPGTPEPLCIELFAGCGGLTLGLHNAGWKGLFAVERDPMAAETLFKNTLGQDAPYPAFTSWPDWLPKENLDLVALLDDKAMRKRLASLRGTVTLVAGGPPCQGFSVGGRRDGLDERNYLVYRMLDFIEIVQPEAVLIENVEGMARRFVSKPGQAKASVADDAIARLEAMGYAAAFRILDSTAFGVPQVRRRIVIFGFRQASAKIRSVDLGPLMEAELKEAAAAIKAKYGLPLNRPITVEEALHDLSGEARVTCPDSPKFEAAPYVPAKSHYAKLMRKGMRRGSIPDSHRFSKHGPDIQRLYALAHNTQPPGRLSKQFLLDNGTKKDKKVLLDRYAPVSTITTHPDEYIHYLEPRNITVREMARLQSFPDDFKFYGRYTINGPRRRFDVARCSQVGNAVPPLMAEGVGLALKRILSLLHSSPPLAKRSEKSREARRELSAA
ncbi:MAG: DNA cytosine methyltransferase [Mesorhizobium sp.]|nr:MAG: DNA cytosine methyltransferase [Mesorhizobium sp.]